MSLGGDLIDFVGGLTIVGGDADGEPFTVLPWEARFLRGAFRRAGDAALSEARGNGKTALCAGIATAVADPGGPLHGNRYECVVVASSFDQSRITYEDVLSFLRERGHDIDDRALWRKQDSANRALIEYRPTGARVRCLGSDPSRMHGIRPKLVLADEPAQWPKETRDRAIAALRTSLGKVPGSKLIALGTRPADDEHFFAKMLERAPYVQVHATPPDDPPFRKRSIRKANPSYDHLPSLRAQIAEEAEEAKRDPDALASFRALRLNQGTDDVARSVLIDGDTWRQALALPEPDVTATTYVLGVDLGQNAAMSAAAAYWRDGRLDAVAVFPEQPDLRERGLADGVGSLYTKMADRGELLTAGGRVSDIPALLAEVLNRWGAPAAVVCDRWREAELLDSLEAVRFPRCPVVVRGQGFMDGGEDVRAFRRAVMSDLVRPAESLLLDAAIKEARTVGDPAGNHKLAKRTEGGRRAQARDDAAAAAVLAVAAGWREWHQAPERATSGGVVAVAR